jgi:hypothetical protein
VRRFITRVLDRITGVLSGFDRLVFRGWLLPLCHEGGMRCFLDRQGVLLKDFEPFAKTLTELVCDPADRAGAKLHDKVVYLNSPNVSKEMVAQNLLVDRPIRQGPIGVLSAVEPCWSWEVHRSRLCETPQTFQRYLTKCLHYYHYFLDRRLGFLHVRVQTWFPFQVRVCVNGREWLGRRLDEHRMRYRRADNCFQWLASPERAQELMDDMLRLPWQAVLDELVVAANPMLATLAEQVGSRFYWTVWQSEVATDVMFKDAESLDSCYPAFLRCAIDNFKSPDVMRFLGRKLLGQYRGEITTDFKRRIEGTRVKHVAQGNSLKMYNKQGNVLRVEQTTTNPGEFRVLRRAHGDPRSQRCLRPLRKGIVDIKRLAAVGKACNARYLDALASVTVETPLQRLLDSITAPAEIGERRVRGLRPWTAPDVTLMEAVSRGEFVMNGFRSRDLLPILFPELPDDPKARRKASAKLTRLLRLLRAHRLIERVGGTYRYMVTALGRTVIAAILAARNASLTKLAKCA